MTNHAHLSSSSEAENLSGILRGLKRHTAKELLRTIEENTQEVKSPAECLPCFWLAPAAGLCPWPGLS
jgi:hypothetical protein